MYCRETPTSPTSKSRQCVEVPVGKDARGRWRPGVRLDHQQHDHAGVGARGATAGVIDRAVALRRLIDDDEVFRLVSGLVAAALAAHRPPGFARPRSIRVACACCHGDCRGDNGVTGGHLLLAKYRYSRSELPDLTTRGSFFIQHIIKRTMPFRIIQSPR